MAPLSYTRMYMEGKLTIYFNYAITKATSKEGKQRKKKWMVRKFKREPSWGLWGEPMYFSSREKAARWVVMDA